MLHEKQHCVLRFWSGIDNGKGEKKHLKEGKGLTALLLASSLVPELWDKLSSDSNTGPLKLSSEVEFLHSPETKLAFQGCSF